MKEAWEKQKIIERHNLEIYLNVLYIDSPLPVGYDISPLSRVKLKILTTRRPTWATEGEFVSPII